MDLPFDLTTTEQSEHDLSRRGKSPRAVAANLAMVEKIVVVRRRKGRMAGRKIKPTLRRFSFEP